MKSGDQLQRGERGVLLIELLIAAGILSVCLAVFFQTLVLGLRTLSDVEDQRTALILLENKMASLVQKGYVSDALDEDGIFPEPFARYQFNIKALPSSIKSGEQEINEVVLTVRWSSGKSSREITLSSLLFAKEE